MDRKCMHNSINDINMDDNILIKKGFDINSKTKKLKLDTFYSTLRKVTKFYQIVVLKLKIVVLKKLYQ